MTLNNPNNFSRCAACFIKIPLYLRRCKYMKDIWIMKEMMQKKSQIKQKILQYLTTKGVSPYEFYKVSGVTRGILTQNNGINEENLARFLAYATDVNPVWLLTGKGDMLLPKSVIDIDIKKSKVRGDQVLVGDMIKIGNPEALHKEEETVCSLRREIDHLNALLKEKDARIASYEDQLKDKSELITEYRATIHDLKQSK